MDKTHTKAILVVPEATLVDDYLHAKNLIYTLIASGDIDNQRILKSDLLRAIWAITEKSNSSQTCDFHRIVRNFVMHQLQIGK